MIGYCAIAVVNVAVTDVAKVLTYAMPWCPKSPTLSRECIPRSRRHNRIVAGRDKRPASSGM